MDMAWNLKKVALTFSSFNAMPNKAPKKKNIMFSGSRFDILIVHNSTSLLHSRS